MTQIKTLSAEQVEWHRADSDRSILLYTLKQDGWRKGEPMMVNDLTVRIENATGSDHDLVPIADAILAALASRHQEPVNEPGEWPDVDEIAQIIRTVDGGHMQGAGQLAERIVVHLNLRAASIPKVEPRASTVFQAIRGYLDAAVAHADVMAAIESVLEPSPSTSEGEAEYADYDAGLLSDFGGGDIGWWQDYVRTEVARANDFWREQIAAPQPTPVSPLPVTITPEMVDAAHSVIAKSFLSEPWVSGPPSLLASAVLTAALSAKPTGEE